MSIGQNIRGIRELKNIQRRYMAKKLGISLTAYGNIEREETKHLTEERLQKIADIFDMAPEEVEVFDSEAAVHHNHNGDNSPNSPVGNNGNVCINEHVETLIELHRHTIAVLDKMAAAFDTVLKNK